MSPPLMPAPHASEIVALVGVDVVPVMVEGAGGADNEVGGSDGHTVMGTSDVRKTKDCQLSFVPILLDCPPRI
jgi:hypothetical protein